MNQKKPRKERLTGYKAYVRAYNEKAAELRQYGAQMSSPMYDPSQFIDIYNAAAKDYSKSKNIPKILAEKQAREYTTAQAKARAAGARARGLIVDKGFAKFRYISDPNAESGVIATFEKQLEARYNQLKDDGSYTKAQIREMLGLEFFYSDEDELD